MVIKQTKILAKNSSAHVSTYALSKLRGRSRTVLMTARRVYASFGPVNYAISILRDSWTGGTVSAYYMMYLHQNLYDLCRKRLKYFAKTFYSSLYFSNFHKGSVGNKTSIANQHQKIIFEVIVSHPD